MGTGVKIADGQPLHVGEKLLAKLQQHAGGYGDHQAAVKEAAGDADAVDEQHQPQLTDEPGKVRVGAADPRHDVIVDDGLEHVGAGDIRPCIHNDADQHQDQPQLVVLNIGKYTQEGTLCVFRLSVAVFIPLSGSRRHITPPPSAEIRILHGKCCCAA